METEIRISTGQLEAHFPATHLLWGDICRALLPHGEPELLQIHLHLSPIDGVPDAFTQTSPQNDPLQRQEKEERLKDLGIKSMTLFLNSSLERSLSADEWSQFVGRTDALLNELGRLKADEHSRHPTTQWRRNNRASTTQSRRSRDGPATGSQPLMEESVTEDLTDTVLGDDVVNNLGTDRTKLVIKV